MAREPFKNRVVGIVLLGIVSSFIANQLGLINLRGWFEPAPRGNTDSASGKGVSVCTGSGDARIKNNTHGTIQMLSGTGTFSHISPTNKRVIVSPGSPLAGTVILRVLNDGPSSAAAPLVETPSWGNAQTVWKTVTNLRTGISTIMVEVDHRAPLQSGTYRVLFAFQLEMTGGNVASGTNWSRRLDVWNDGNDLVQIGPEQVSQAQKFGCAVDPWLTEAGFELFYVPLDAITVEVMKVNEPSAATGEAVWLGFANHTGMLDREADLRINCGDFKRVYVPLNAGNKFTDLCNHKRKTCEKICDWEGKSLPCSAISRGGKRDGTRIALCR